MSMIPSVQWGQRHREQKQEDAGQSQPQRLACITCVLDGHSEPPDVIVMWGGHSYCVPHVRAAGQRTMST